MMSEPEINRLKDRIHEIIFEADTPTGYWFDIALLILIIGSIIAVMLETVPKLEPYKNLFYILEWFFTIIFTAEYALRMYCVRSRRKYATSFFGIVDVVSILPAYIGLIIAGTHSLTVFRALRLLRVFRIFKLGHFLNEGDVIMKSLKASQAKISVFLFFILVVVIIIGSIMYLVEGEANPQFSSIPNSVYWAIVTLTTVGYGDISPVTDLGKFLSAIVMIMGYAVIAVPTGIVSAEIVNESKKDLKYHNTQVCRYCMEDNHDDDAIFCKKCGERLNAKES